MKIKIDNDELKEACFHLKNLNDKLEDLIFKLSQEVKQPHQWAGKSADAYQQALRELIKEHQKMVRLYQELSDTVLSMNQDLEDYKLDLIQQIKISSEGMIK